MPPTPYAARGTSIISHRARGIAGAYGFDENILKSFISFYLIAPVIRATMKQNFN
jgi:hypothetical protein